MSDVLVDTDVVSFLFKLDTRAALLLPHLAGKQPAVSFMTLAELERWTLQRDWGAARRGALDHYLQRFAVYFADLALCHTWARVVDGARRKGRPIKIGDAWIAATAVLHNLPLLTHNPSDYAGVDGLQLLTVTQQ